MVVPMFEVYFSEVYSMQKSSSNNDDEDIMELLVENLIKRYGLVYNTPSLSSNQSESVFRASIQQYMIK